jgi:hypothetical protein
VAGASIHGEACGGDSVKPKPKTPREWAAYRCKVTCQIGRDVLSGKTKTPPGGSPLEYALFNLLHAVEELAELTSKDK